MRKIKFLSYSLVAGFSALALNSSVHAVPLSSGTPVTVALCSVLSADVTVNLSKNVAAGYVCRVANAAATPPTLNRVGIGACNTGGTAKSRDVACSRLSDGGTPPTFTYTPATCSASNFDPATGIVLAVGGTVPVTGSAIYTTSTSGGVIGENGMATAACTGAGISPLVEAAYP